jgi:hypothetical protein
MDSIEGPTDVKGGSKGSVKAAEGAVSMVEEVVGGSGAGVTRAKAVLMGWEAGDGWEKGGVDDAGEDPVKG